MTHRRWCIRQVQGGLANPSYFSTPWQIEASLRVHWRVRLTVVWDSHAHTSRRYIQASFQTPSPAPVFPFWSFYGPRDPMVYGWKRKICYNGHCRTQALAPGDFGWIWLEHWPPQSHLSFEPTGFSTRLVADLITLSTLWGCTFERI